MENILPFTYIFFNISCNEGKNPVPRNDLSLEIPVASQASEQIPENKNYHNPNYFSQIPYMDLAKIQPA